MKKWLMGVFVFMLVLSFALVCFGGKKGALPPPSLSANRIIVAQNPPGQQDEVSGYAHAVEGSAPVTVKVYRNAALTGLLGSTTASANGSFSAIKIGDNLAGTVYIVVSNADGTSQSVKKNNDIVAPAAPIANKITVQNLPDQLPQVSGASAAVEGSAMVKVYKDADLTKSLGSTTANPEGSFSAKIGDDLVDIIYVRAEDAAGNPSTPTQVKTATLPQAKPEQVSAGGSHTCLLVKNTGAVKCWGSNEKGQLGNGTYQDSNVPVNVIDLKDATFISAGQNHTCAIMENGGVKCWGSNWNGQLGAKNVSPGSKVPIDVEGLDGEVITAISAGTKRTVAVTKKGALKWWGSFPGGQGIAVDVNGQVDDMISVTSGDEYTCALTKDDKVQCWYYKNTLTPTTGYIAVGMEEVSSGGPNHACAVTDDHGVKCWGNNDQGQLGNGSTQPISTQPTSIPTTVVDVVGSYNLDITKAVSAGGNHTCALFTVGTGNFKCWGDNANGQLGNDSTNDSLTPTKPAYSIVGYYFTGISAGGSHTCALSEQGVVWCWGSNAFGQLGDGTTTERHVPTMVTVTY